MKPFSVVEDLEIPETGAANPAAISAAQAAVEQDRKRATQLLMLGLGTVGKRLLIAASNFFGLLTVASVWVLWWQRPDPTTHQLVALGMYAAFILIVNLIVRRA